MLRQRLYTSQYSFFDKLKSIDYFLVFLILILLKIIKIFQLMSCKKVIKLFLIIKS